MVFLYNHNSFHIPITTTNSQGNYYYKTGSREHKHFSSRRLLKELTPESKHILLSLGFNLQKKKKENQN